MTTKQRLEQLRKIIRAGNLSYGELAKLQDLSEYIDKGDVELLEWAGVPEFDSSVDDEMKENYKLREEGEL
jgi:hypothetical protein